MLKKYKNSIQIFLNECRLSFLSYVCQSINLFIYMTFVKKNTTTRRNVIKTEIVKMKIKAIDTKHML